MSTPNSAPKFDADQIERRLGELYDDFRQLEQHEAPIWLRLLQYDIENNTDNPDTPRPHRPDKYGLRLLRTMQLAFHNPRRLADQQWYEYASRRKPFKLRCLNLLGTNIESVARLIEIGQRAASICRQLHANVIVERTSVWLEADNQPGAIWWNVLFSAAWDGGIIGLKAPIKIYDYDEDEGFAFDSRIPNVSPDDHEYAIISDIQNAAAASAVLADALRQECRRKSPDENGYGGTANSEKVSNEARKSWKQVQAELLAMRERNENPRTYRELGAELGVSISTISKAVSESPLLKGWLARHKSPKSERSIDEVVIGKAQAPNDDTFGITDEEADIILNKLMNQAQPDERARLNSMSADARKKLAAIYQSQEQDRQIDESEKGRVHRQV